MSDPQPPRRRSGRAALIALGVVAIALASWAFVIEPGSLTSSAHVLHLRQWPAECGRLRIAVLADLHVGSPHNGPAELARLVARTQRERPDLILLAGDYVITGVVGGTPITPEQIAPELAKLRAPLGVWAVLGNHDWWLDGERVSKALEAAGIRMLDNAATPLQAQRCKLWLLGIGDYWEGKPDIERALSFVTTPDPILAFTHNPDIFPEVPERIALTIAGHTTAGKCTSRASVARSSRRSSASATRSATSSRTAGTCSCRRASARASSPCAFSCRRRSRSSS